MNAPEQTDVLIAGGGPAGSLLACLLARRGVSVVLVEKETKLQRSFRGENIAARSVRTLRELGFGPLLAEAGFLELTGVTVREDGKPLMHIDYGKFSLRTLPIDIPQPSLIGLFTEQARLHTNCTHLNGTTLTGLLEEDGAVVGATVRSAASGTREIRARIVIGADGRFSRVRKRSGLPVDVQPMARDFLSFLVPRPEQWGQGAELVVSGDRHLVVLPTYPDMLRIGHNLPKRGLAELRAAGFPAFRESIASLDPRLAPLVHAHLTSWDDTGFLEIFTAEMERWTRNGLLLIGDASHTATPILGQGVNLAIQDAVSVVPVLVRALATGSGPVPESALLDFVADRKRHKQLVTRYQRMQEASLSESRPARTRVRRARLRVLNALPIKYRLLDKVINAPHPIDPVDVQLGLAAARIPAMRAPRDAELPTPVAG